MNIKIRKVFCCRIYHVCMLLCKTVNYFVSVNMLVFSDVAQSKWFESIVPMADGSVETVDVAMCLKRPILKVDVAIDTDDLVTQVDQACCTNDLILRVDATCYTNGLIYLLMRFQYQDRVKPDPTTTQEQNKMKPNPTTQPTRGSE